MDIRGRRDTPATRAGGKEQGSDRSKVAKAHRLHHGSDVRAETGAETNDRLKQRKSDGAIKTTYAAVSDPLVMPLSLPERARTGQAQLFCQRCIYLRFA